MAGFGDRDFVQAASEDIGRLVDQAAFDPNLWHEVVAELGRRIPGTKPALQVFDTTAERGIPMLHWGWETGSIDAYARHYGTINPWTPVVLQTPALVSMYSEILLPASSFRDTEFYTDWLRHVGEAEASSGIKLLDGDGRLAVVTIQHGLARADRTHARLGPLLDRLGPRMRRALEANRVRFPTAKVPATARALLADLADPAFVVTGDLHLIEASGPGQAMLAAGDLIRVGARNRLHFPHARLGRAFAAETALACAGSETLTGDASVALAQERIRIVALSLRTDLTGQPGLAPLFSPNRLALVILRRAASGQARAEHSLSGRFGLSPAETRLALLMDGSVSLVEAARILGIGHETARTQIRQVFAKLGLSRQSELAVFVQRLKGQV
ncbi:helix-turn-helix transcriptional regulator [Methylobacterium terricola]|uniref:Helix-turn-helix transcriptional regulator n=1 Tax=Methylobacterium terricola TaxID=2583531 RepID=A0A5C4LKK0_9HYPH|nr:helix-turn-helix transcriptional regulator [Methylobacterium terricola]TNC15026.1 helix-turn-helix transcriptional regulator [Methylobacterium terricola]